MAKQKPKQPSPGNSLRQVAEIVVANDRTHRQFIRQVCFETFDDLRRDLMEPESSPAFVASQAEGYRRLTTAIGETPFNDPQAWRDEANRLGIHDAATAALNDEFAGRIGNALRRRLKRKPPPTRWSIPRSKSDWVRILKTLGVAISLKTFARRLNDGNFRRHPDTKTTSKMVSLDTSSLPEGYSDEMKAQSDEMTAR